MPRRTHNRHRTAEYPGGYRIPSDRILPTIISAGVAYAVIRALIQTLAPSHGFPGWMHSGQYLVTWVTGLWYFIRYHFTEGVTAQDKGFISIASTMFIWAFGLICFPLSEFSLWYIAHAIVLVLAVVKDIEVMRFQQSQMRDAGPRTLRAWRGAMLTMYECHVMVRDAFMAMWWVVYGIVCFHYDVPAETGVLVFGIPYTVCVCGWCIVKVRMHYLEILRRR